MVDCVPCTSIRYVFMNVKNFLGGGGMGGAGLISNALAQ